MSIYLILDIRYNFCQIMVKRTSTIIICFIFILCPINQNRIIQHSNIIIHLINKGQKNQYNVENVCFSYINYKFSIKYMRQKIKYYIYYIILLYYYIYYYINIIFNIFIKYTFGTRLVAMHCCSGYDRWKYLFRLLRENLQISTSKQSH